MRLLYLFSMTTVTDESLHAYSSVNLLQIEKVTSNVPVCSCENGFETVLWHWQTRRREIKFPLPCPLSLLAHLGNLAVALPLRGGDVFVAQPNVVVYAFCGSE